MRKTYRDKNTFDYWARRWAHIPPDKAMENEKSYPLRYALSTVLSRPGKILEAGCGTGRVLRYFHNRGYNVVGIDYIASAVEKLKKVDPTLRVTVGDIRDLNYPDKYFDVVLAFGLYHNLYGTNLLKALVETHRIMAPNAILCASFRADNLCNRINDWIYDSRSRLSGGKYFHKLNLTADEFRLLLESTGFVVSSFQYVENMPLLYKFSIWRSSTYEEMDEHKDRLKGYKLNAVGRFLQSCLMRFFPKSFCNVYVVTAVRE